MQALSGNQSRGAFWLLCVPARVAITLYAYQNRALSWKEDKAFTAFGASFAAYQLACSAGWLSRVTGPEQKRIWWQTMRPVHAVLWGTFVGLKVSTDADLHPLSWLPLALDVSFGMVTAAVNNPPE